MIRLIDLYIGRALLAATGLALLVLEGLNLILKFVNELKSVGRGNYDLIDAIIYTLYSVPRDLELFVPMAVLLGALIGIGGLAASSELVVLMAAGMSRAAIARSALKTALPLMVALLLLGEFGTPLAEQAAKELRTTELTGGTLIESQAGTWTRDEQAFVNIGRVESETRIRDLTIFHFDERQQLQRIVHAESAQFEQGRWLLQQVRETYIGAEQLTASDIPQREWRSVLTPDKLKVVSVKPDSLSLRGLDSYIDYLDASGQDGSRYRLAFWRKLAQPLSVAVMVVLALSFIFGPLRSVTMGARVLMGVAAGFSFYVLDQLFGPLALVYQFPAWLGALLPPLVALSVALLLLRRRA